MTPKNIGRPKKVKGQKKITSFRIEKDDWNEATTLAKDLGMTTSRYIELAVVEKNKKVGRLLQKQKGTR